MHFVTLAALVLFAFVTSTRCVATESPDGPSAEWPYYGGDAGGSRYSPLTQITKDNVTTLRVAWEYHTGEVSDGSGGRRPSTFEATPIVAHDTLYVTTPFNRVVALDPETGREQWQFDPQIAVRGPYSEGLINRGVALWTDPNRAAGTACRQRIFLATIDARLCALDAATGQPCADFGTEAGPGGQIDLTRGIANITRRGEYQETSAPAVVEDLVIVGSAIADNDRVASPSGEVRAFDARTGALRWRWQPLPTSLAPTGAGNAWSTLSVDAARGLVFVPTGAPSP